MNLFKVLLLSVLTIPAIGQEFEISAEQYPFYSMVEWKGTGSILFNRDPSGVTRKVNMTMVSDQLISTWQESFNPNGKEYYYISSENARYIYFLDDLQPEYGKFSLHQISSAGNVKSTSVNLSSTIKKLGFDPGEVTLIDIVTTDKALVHLFRHKNSKDKKYTDFATFVTHHNFLSYGIILGEVGEKEIKEGMLTSWQYVGFNDDEIYFASRMNQNSKQGWSVQHVSSKGVLKESLFIKAPKQNFVALPNTGLGAVGKSYMKSDSDVEAGTLIRQGNKFYLLGLTGPAEKNALQLFELKEGEWKLLNKTELAAEATKKITYFGVFPLNEGVGTRVGNQVIFLPFDTQKQAVAQEFNPLMNFNPSRYLSLKKKELFTVSLPTGDLFFDTKQLNQAGNVKFEFIKK